MPEEKQSEKSRRILREMERKSQDVIKIFNPQEKDYILIYDARQWVIPNKDKDLGYDKGCLDVPRYIANHYFKHMIDGLINEESTKVVAKAKKEYKGGHWPEEELKVALRTSNPELRKKYLKILYKGVVREFAISQAPLEVADPRCLVSFSFCHITIRLFSKPRQICLLRAVFVLRVLSLTCQLQHTF